MAVHTFKCIDAHTCGNPVRLVVDGGPKLVGKTMEEKRQHFLQEFDWIRTGLMFEPRGHDMMSGSILYEPHDPKNDIAILFIETSGCLPMCGHGTIGTITIALEEGLIQPKTEGKVRLETPAGLVEIDYYKSNDKVAWVKLTNVTSYLAEIGLRINSSILGELFFDVAFGGNFYAIIDRQKNFSGMHDFKASELIQFSQEIRKKINTTYLNRFIHPENPNINKVSHILWTGDSIDKNASGRNAVFYGDKAIDRSPCGTGTSARMAQLYAKGLLKIGEEYIHESFIGSKFVGKVEQETVIMNQKAIIPSIKGWAKIYGRNTITIDTNDDPYALGFQVL
ncbi:4-hydroxyproline epimerase [Flagellimonas sp. HMM57]|uniref:4-hydroxyproline epimerase n=1 Tax=unclassified Flagellimonas TaxID=2644544 RepID=UPI0013D66C42|nr:MULTISPECIES: 4-hydroxyproline epimerase [unclassified Flagellimonas]UII76049.1 4-hydroxyproline epimerase [Flagellimonas sp. HMM57]